MHHQKYKYQPKNQEQPPNVYIRSTGHRKIMSPPQSPTARNNAAPHLRDHYLSQKQRQYNLSPRGRATAGSTVSRGQDKVKMLINEVLNSADAVATELLRYDRSEEESLCSRYYLHRQKLTSYLSKDQNRPFETISSKFSKKVHSNRNKKKFSEDDLLDGEITPDQLARLEDIVYGKVIPILQTELDCERKIQENIKKAKNYKQTELNQGLMLLERLQDKKNFVGFDGYVEVLEKFIRRVMDKEEVLMDKLFKLQEKLEQQMEKTQKLSKDRQRHNFKREGRLGSKSSTVESYQKFVRQVKALLKDSKSSSSSQQSLAVELDLLTARIKHIVNSYPESQKEVHAHCRQQMKKSQQQIKSLKSVAKNLDAEIQNLKQECQVLEEKVISSSDKLCKFQQKSRKTIQENEELTAEVNLLNRDITYKNHLIGEYLGIIGKLEDHIKMKEESESQLEVENERHVENIIMKNEGYDKLLRHVSDIEERNKELEEGEEAKDRELQNALQQLYVKQFEVTHLTSTHERVVRDYEEVKLRLQQKEEELIQLEEELKMLRGSRQRKQSKQMIMGLVSKESQTYESYDSSPTFNMGGSEEVIRAAYPPIRDHLILGLGIDNVTHTASQTRPLTTSEMAIQAGESAAQVQKKENKEKQEEDDEVDVLRQTIKLLEHGLQNSHKQVEELNYQNKILLSHNEALYQANLPNYMMGFPLDRTIYAIAAYAVDDYRGPSEQPDSNNKHQRPDFIPAHINKKKLIEEIVKMSSDQKEEQKEQPHSLAEEMNSVQETGEFKQPQNANQNIVSPINELEYDTEEAQETRRKTFDPGHRAPLPPQEEQQNLQRRPDFDPGHRLPPEEETQRRSDWDPGHRVTPPTIEEHAQRGSEELVRENREMKNIIKAKDKFITILETKIDELEEQLHNLKKEQEHRAHHQVAPNPFNALTAGWIPHPSSPFLEQINKQLEMNLAKAQQQIQKLSQQNRILVSHNEALYQANLPNYLKGFPTAVAFEGVAAVPLDDGLPSSGSYSGNERPDFIPSNTNKGTENKKQLDEKQKEKRPDQDPGHRVPPEQAQQRPPERRIDSTAQNPEEQASVADNPEEVSQTALDNIEAIEDAQPNTGEQHIQEVQIPELINQLAQEKEPSLQQIQNSIHQSRQRKKSGTNEMIEIGDNELIKIEDKKEEGLKASDQLQLPPEVYDHYKIRQMIEMTERVRQKLTILRKEPENINMKQEIRVVLDDIEIIYSMLMICKKNTTSKLNKLITVESQKKEVQEQNQRLQRKLEAANHLFSSITPNSEGSGMTFEEQLQQIVRSKTLNQDNIIRRDTITSVDLRPQSRGSHKEMVDHEVQTDCFNGILLESQVKRYLPELRRMMTSESAINNSILNRSFIDELEQLTSQKMEKIQSLVQEVQPVNQTSPVRRNADSDGSQDLHLSRIRLDNEVQNIDSWIGIHKQQLFNLHRLLKKTASLPPKFDEQFSPDSPIRRPILENDQYIAVINNAPKKENSSSSSRSQGKKEQMTEGGCFQEVKEMFKNRQNEFTTIITQKEQQINRLMAIVQKISQNRLVQAKMTPRASRNIEDPNHELEGMKTKIGDLELALDIMKTENQRLKMQMKEAELQQELARIEANEEAPRSNIPEANDPAEHNLHPTAEGKNIVKANEDQVRTEYKEGDKEQSPTIRIHSELVSQQSPKPKFERKNILQRRTFHYREGSPRSAEKIETNWQELMPQFFGKKQQKRGQH